MPAPSSVDEFIEVCLKSGVVDESHLQQLAKETPSTPAVAAKTLLNARAITKFQASQLLAGKYKGLRFDRLKLLDRLGSGAAGTVFLCEHLALGKNVAVKLLPPELCRNDEKREHFFRDARAAAALGHPNIVRVFDMSSSGGVHYLVMEYVEGRDLHTILGLRGPLPCGRACTYVAQAALGLQHAHEKGLVHGDIKPGNLLTDKDGTIKILNMGLSRSQEVPPDIRADIHALGVTLRTLLQGLPKPDGSMARREIPQGLSAIIDKMTANNPADRYQTPADVVAALTPWLETETVSVEVEPTPLPPETVECEAPPSRPRKSHLKLLLATGAAGLLVLGAGLALFLLAGDKKPMPVVETKPTPEPTPEPTVTDDAKTVLSRVSGSHFSPRVAADRTREYRAELEYQAGAAATSQLRLDEGNGRSRWIADLPATGGAWKTVSVPVWPTISSAAARLELHHTGTGKDNQLAVRRLAMRDFGPTIPSDSRPVIRLQPDSSAPVSLRRVGKQEPEQTGDLPPGFALSNEEDGSVTELAIGEFEGSAALRITNVFGRPSAVLTTPLVPNAAGGEYDLRLEYLAVANALAATVRVLPEGADAATMAGELYHTNSAWRELRTRFRTKPGERFRLEVRPHAAGTDKPLLIRSLEVRPYQAPKAGTWITLAKLDAAVEKPFRLETIKGVSHNTLLKLPLPAGWSGDSWREGDRGSFTCETYRGRPAFTLLNGVGSESVQMHTHQPITSLRAGEQCVVKVVYFAEEKTRGIIEHRPGMQPATKLSATPLPATGGDWKTLEIELTPTEDGPLYAFIQNHAAGPQTRLAVASYEVMIRRQ